MAQRKWHEAEEALHEDGREMEDAQQNPAEALVLLGFVALAKDQCGRGDRPLSRSA